MGEWVDIHVMKIICTPCLAYIKQILPPYAVAYRGYTEYLHNPKNNIMLPCGTTQLSILAVASAIRKEDI